MIDLGVEMGIMKKSGAFFSYGETKLGQGRENVRDYLIRHKDVSGEIEALIRGNAVAAAAGVGIAVSPVIEQDEEGSE